MINFLIGYLVASNNSASANTLALFCLACGSAAVLFLLFAITVVVGNRLGYEWARAFYPNIFLPDWRKS